jgi:hypothetical protein
LDFGVWLGRLNGGGCLRLWPVTPRALKPRGRRLAKYTPENVQKIRDLVAQGISREKIAELLNVTLAHFGQNLLNEEGGRDSRIVF